jgi:hypothetical protein
MFITRAVLFISARITHNAWIWHYYWLTGKCDRAPALSLAPLARARRQPTATAHGHGSATVPTIHAHLRSARALSATTSNPLTVHIKSHFRMAVLIDEPVTNAFVPYRKLGEQLGTLDLKLR